MTAMASFQRLMLVRLRIIMLYVRTSPLMPAFFMPLYTSYALA